MTVEEWAQKILCRELGCSVELHDDGSQPGMYDLRVGEIDAPKIAVECVGAVDQTATETWNVGQARGPILINSKTDWLVSIIRGARIKDISHRIGEILQNCEYRNLVDYIPVDWSLKRFDADLFESFSKLGVTSFHGFRPDGQGKVYLSMDGGGGLINSSGDGIAEWVAEFLNSEDRRDVRQKLSKSNAAEKHVFVPIVPGGAPWEVESYFLSSMCGKLSVPELPNPVDSIWLISNGKGLVWRHNGWNVFHATESAA